LKMKLLFTLLIRQAFAASLEDGGLLNGNPGLIADGFMNGNPGLRADGFMNGNPGVERSSYVPSYDVSEALVGRTIYIEYNFYSGYWITPSDSYNGALSDVDDELIYVPKQRVRLEVEDCNEGYVCLRTRWNEDEESEDYYLQTGYYDVDFEKDSSPGSNDRLNWHIYCTNGTEMDNCWICDKYYSQDYPNEYWNCLYGTAQSSLKADWNTDHPAEWFSWNIVTPTAVDAGFVETDTSPCNAAGHDVTVGLDLCVGVEINSSYIWQITSSVGRELENSIQLDIVNAGDSSQHSTEWAEQINNSDVFQQEDCTRYNTIVENRKKMSLVQLEATYGPYLVKGSKFQLVSTNC